MPAILNISSHPRRVFARHIVRSKDKPSKEVNSKPAVEFYCTPLTRSDDNKNLPNGWYKMSPFSNGFVKVYDTKQDIPKTMWMIVWAREHASLRLGIPYKPVPKNSLIYKHIKSNDPEKQKILEEFEDLITSSYLEARNFLSEYMVIQTGIEIVGDKEHFMASRGFYGAGTVEVAYPYVDFVLELIESGDKEKVQKCKKLFKASFVHEFVHQIRGEVDGKVNVGEEIASHAIELLAGGGDNSFRDQIMEDELVDHTSYRYQDIIAALKIVQKKLSSNKHCKYIPEGYELTELNKAMKSIPENIRERELKKIAKEIVKVPYVDLFRIALQAS